MSEIAALERQVAHKDAALDTYHAWLAEARTALEQEVSNRRCLTANLLEQIARAEAAEAKGAEILAALESIADTQLEDGTLCWCSHGGPFTSHSHECERARAAVQPNRL
jgi:uncharacterized coiled-coil protein SlyX